MPTYLFVDEANGKVVERITPMSESVPIGNVIKVREGRKVRRLRRLPDFDGAGMVEPDFAHVAWQLDPNDPNAPKERDPRTNQPIFLNRKRIEEYMAADADRPRSEKLCEFRYDFGIHK